MNTAKRYLTVDGDFFAHRALHGIRLQNKNVTLDSAAEMKNFHHAIINSLHNLYEVFKNHHHNLVDQIIFVFDHHSWRKQITPFKPYYLEKEPAETLSIGYKENRGEMKKKSEINYDNFELCKDDFRELLIGKKIFPVFFVNGCEGDDALCLLKQKLLEENKDNKMIVFCTDGDLKQLLDVDEDTKSDAVILYRNIKSTVAPEGEMVISRDLFDSLYGQQDMLSSFLSATSTEGNSFETYKNTLFNVNFKDQDKRANYKRSPGEGISIGTPYLTLLSKCILGDKKDNIFPIFRWKTLNGKQLRNVTEKHIINVMVDDMKLTFNEENCKMIWNSKPDLTQLLFGLLAETKQNLDENCDIQKVGKHFVHNRQLLNIISSQYIPVDQVSKFNLAFEEQMDLIDKNLSNEELASIKYQTTDSTNILAQSLPDLPDELKDFADLLS